MHAKAGCMTVDSLGWMMMLCWALYCDENNKCIKNWILTLILEKTRAILGSKRLLLPGLWNICSSAYKFYLRRFKELNIDKLSLWRAITFDRLSAQTLYTQCHLTMSTPNVHTQCSLTLFEGHDTRSRNNTSYRNWSSLFPQSLVLFMCKVKVNNKAIRINRNFR